MGYVKTQRKELTSVGIDVGTTTSHIIFSRIVLEKDASKRTEKFEIVERRVIHKGEIHMTPFSAPDTIDLVRLKEMLDQDYSAAGFRPDDIDTGAVIITGETARKHNAEEIVTYLAGKSGKFVAATAGPNFEAVIAAHGSGAVKRSLETRKTVMNVDTGGGSSNMAVCKAGKVVDTAAVNVGGRLIAFDGGGILRVIEQGGRKTAEQLGITLEIGKPIQEADREAMARSLARSLLEAMRGQEASELTKRLMMTRPLKVNGIDEVTFSGGVAEYIYEREDRDFGDIGKALAQFIRTEMESSGMHLTEPDQKIRATVIGAGQSSLQVSGSTTFLSAGLTYPIRNLPAVVADVPKTGLTSHQVASAIASAFERLDLVEGVDPVILAFNDAVRPSYESLTTFAKGVVSGLPHTVSSGRTIMMCFDSDIGNSVGNVIRRETKVTNEILSIDEVSLREGDFVDIGQPIIENVVVPVVIKTLVFESG